MALLFVILLVMAMLAFGMLFGEFVIGALDRKVDCIQ